MRHMPILTLTETIGTGYACDAERLVAADRSREMSRKISIGLRIERKQPSAAHLQHLTLLQ